MVFLNNQIDSAKSLKEEMVRLLGGGPSDRFLFAMNGKRAVEQVFLSTYFDQVRDTGRTHFLTEGHPIPSIKSAARYMEKLGCVVKPLPANEQGIITPDALESEIRERTSLVSLSWIDPVTGVIQPIKELSKICAEKGVLLHVDASCSLGKIDCDLGDLKVDFLTFEGRFFHAPQGTAGLLVREGSGVRLDEEETSAQLFQALVSSLKTALRHLDQLSTETARLKKKFEEALLAHLPNLSILFSESARAPSISAIAFSCVHKEMLRFLLKRRGIYAGADSLEHDVLSFSLSYETTEEEIDSALEEIISAVKKVRALAPV